MLFYFLKINVFIEKYGKSVIILESPEGTLAKKGEARPTCYCYLLTTGGTVGAQAMQQAWSRWPPLYGYLRPIT